MTTTPSASPSSRTDRQAELAQVLTWQAASAEHPTADELQIYVEAQLTGLPYHTEYADLSHHLDACVACAEAYGRLYELVLAEQQASLAVPARLPEADLAFLEPEAQIPWLAQIQAAIEQVGQHLTLQLRPDLLPGLQPALARGAFRAPSDGERYREQILDLNEEELPLALVAYRDAQQPDQCMLEITLSPPDRSWPDLADIEVTIQLSTETRLATTDAWGLAVFVDVPIDRLAELRVAVAL